MDPHGKFLPPKTKEEFEARAAELELGPAKAILGTLEQRREGMVANIDAEIKFYKEVIELKEKQS